MNPELSQRHFEKDISPLSDARLLNLRGWEIKRGTYPNLDVLFKKDGRDSVMICFECTGWPETPPSIAVLTAQGATLNSPIKNSAFNHSPHPISGMVPFICLPGSREYHLHSSHVSDLWENHRHQETCRSLGKILERIWDAWLKAVNQ